MYLAQAKLGEDALHGLVAIFQILEVYLLALADERIDDVNLPPELYLLAYAVVERCRLVVILVKGLYGLASRRQLVRVIVVVLSLHQ